MALSFCVTFAFFVDRSLILDAIDGESLFFDFDFRDGGKTRDFPVRFTTASDCFLADVFESAEFFTSDDEVRVGSSFTFDEYSSLVLALLPLAGI